ncbi:MAG: cation:proton antiporter, partial [Anaerolineales bacterium]|nr:cation:proton antiporter [Anaerolineales bacterium]
MSTLVIANKLFAEGNGELIQQELGFILLLAIAAGVAIIVRYTRFNLPYTVALVLVGLAIAFIPQGVIQVEIGSDLILAILLPPLLFEATLHIKFEQFRLDMVPILLFALVGSLIATFIVASLMVWLLGLSWSAAIAFGALISATDPVAVIAFFRSLGVSKRLALLVEGESLLNDAIALVLFVMAVATAGGDNAVTLASSMGQFLSISFGGLGVGIMLGSGVSYLILKNVNDHLIETVTTITLAFGSYIVAEELHVSGILAVVAAGLFVGNVGFDNTSPTTQLAMINFWEMLAFIANSLIFLVIGLEIDIITAVQNSWLAILIAVAAVLLSRVIVVYSLAAFNKLVNPRRDIPMPFRHIMFWGGM